VTGVVVFPTPLFWLKKVIVVGKSISPFDEKTRLSMERRAEERLLLSNICAKISFRSQNLTSPGLFEPPIAGPGLNE
jgi:hypothetical protein